MIRSLLGTALAAVLVFAAPGGSPASALTLTAAGGTTPGTMTCNLPPNVTPVSSYFETGTNPVAEAINCFTAGSFANGASSASAGHVGAEATSTAALNGFGARLDTTGIYSDIFVFHAKDPGSTGGTATVQLNLGLAGLLQVSGDFATASVDFGVTFTAQDVGHFTASLDTTGAPQCTSSFVGGAGCGAIFLPGAAVTALLTRPTEVGLDVPVLIQLRMDVDVTASNFGSGSGALFNNSLDFPTGVPLFVLPDGITVDAPDSFVLDNVFVPPGASAVPEPAALALLGAGLVGLGFARRRPAAASGANGRNG
jgi:hypothetical protein